MNSAMRKAAVVLVATPIMLALSHHTVDEKQVPAAVRDLFNPDKIGLFEFKQARARLYSEAESSFRDGGWDIERLDIISHQYYKSFLPRYSSYLVTADGVPKATLEMMPVIKEVAREYSLDPNLLAAIQVKESYGFKYAMDINMGAQHPELSMGLGQVNLVATPVDRWQYRHIFSEHVNLGLSAEKLRKCIGRYHNTAQAIRAYNKGLYAPNTPAMAREDAYVKGVERYLHLVRKDYTEPHGYAHTMARR